jgi:hypothetical protein
LDGETGVREPDPGTHGGDLDSARFDPTVPTVSVLGGDRDLRPGQPDQPGMQLRLVRLRDQQVVPAAVVQVLGVCALGVQRVRGDQHIGQVETVQQRGERGEFVGLALDLGLAQHRPGGGSIAASRCTWVCSSVRAPRAVFPSTATTRIRPGRAGGTRLDSQDDSAASSESRSTACRIRRIVDSLGARRPIPSRNRTLTGRSWAHSAIAT